MKKLLKSKNLWIFLIALLTTVCASINVINWSFDFDGNDFKWIIVFGVLCVLFSKALEKTNKRLLICSRYIWFCNILLYYAGEHGDNRRSYHL